MQILLFVLAVLGMKFRALCALIRGMVLFFDSNIKFFPWSVQWFECTPQNSCVRNNSQSRDVKRWEL
jgi:hypothetical protein